MRKIILSVMVTLDGFTAGPNGELDWVAVRDWSGGRRGGSATISLRRSRTTQRAGDVAGHRRAIELTPPVRPPALWLPAAGAAPLRPPHAGGTSGGGSRWNRPHTRESH